MPGGISFVEVYYKFTGQNNWTIANMNFDDDTKLYSFDIPLPIVNGSLTYKIRAYDNVGLITESEIFNFDFENGAIFGPGSNFIADIINIVILIAGIGIIGVGGYFFYPKLKSYTKSLRSKESE